MAGMDLRQLLLQVLAKGSDHKLVPSLLIFRRVLQDIMNGRGKCEFWVLVVGDVHAYAPARDLRDDKR